MPDHEPTPKPPDYYFENGLLVYTAAYHLKRGYCCGSGCRHCPYEPKHRRGGRNPEKGHAAQETQQTPVAAGESGDRLHALLQAFGPSKPLVGKVTAETLADIDRRLAMLQDRLEEAFEAASRQKPEGPPNRTARS